MTLKIIIFSLLIALAIFALFGLKRHPRNVVVRHFISGTFVAEEHDHFCSCWDTLIVISYKPHRNIFRIKRTTCYIRWLSDSTFPKQIEKEDWRGIYDETSHTLSGFTADYRLQFYSDLEALVLSGVTYLRAMETIPLHFQNIQK